MAQHLLSDRAVRNAKPDTRPYRLFDGDGLCLYVAPTGTRSWQLRYKLNGKSQTATLGRFSDMTLAEARVEASSKRKLVAGGKQLTQARQIERATQRAAGANTFELVARDWVSTEARRQKWTERYRGEVERSITNHLATLNPLPLAELSAPLLAPLMRAVEDTSPYMVEKVRRRLRAILDYAIEQGVITGNPLPATRRGSKLVRRNYPAVTDLAGVGAILRAAGAADACKGVLRGHLLLAFTAQRVSEVVGAAWSEFDLDAGVWSIPRERMKVRKDSQRGPHDVPLPPKLLAQLREWRRADGDKATFVCVAPRDATKHVTPESLEKHYRNALDFGGKHSPHSWRSAFKTISANAGQDRDACEVQLDHVVAGGTTVAAYDRAKRLGLRAKLMTWYEATLLAARDGAKVIKLKTS